MVREHNISLLTLTEYFSKVIYRESKNLLPPLSEAVIHYLTQLLVYFSESNRLFKLQHNAFSLPTLALLYQDVHNATNSHRRNASLRELGDSSIFIGALFFEHFAKKEIHKDYFIGMGSSAYSSLADYDYGNKELFYELAEKFPKLLQIVANVCALELNYKAEEVFSLLERWQQSKDPMLRKQLHAIGIAPLEFDYQQ